MGWGGTHGGKPRALVAGEGWGGRRGCGSCKEKGGLGPNTREEAPTPTPRP